MSKLSEFDSGLNTTPLMWDLLSKMLDGEDLPDSLNKAIYALRDGKAIVAPREAE